MTTENPNFVNIADLDNSIEVHSMYFNDFNFLGRRVNGYNADKIFMTKECADSLLKVQEKLNNLTIEDLEKYCERTKAELEKLNILENLKNCIIAVFDGYRPIDAVQDFYDWSKDQNDTKMKAYFYPNLDKTKVHEKGYIAPPDRKSAHSRGSTVDLTLVKKYCRKIYNPKISKSEREFNKGNKFLYCPSFENEIDMGTHVDYFGEESHTDSKLVSELAQINRKFLKNLMENFGFKNYEKEWWHYTLIDEPYPNQYFNVPVE